MGVLTGQFSSLINSSSGATGCGTSEQALEVRNGKYLNFKTGDVDDVVKVTEFDVAASIETSLLSE